LRGKINLEKKEIPRPSKFPHCGFEKIYKNGTYKITVKRLLNEFKKGKKRR